MNEKKLDDKKHVGEKIERLNDFVGEKIEKLDDLAGEFQGRIKSYMSGFLRAVLVALLVLAQCVLLVTIALWLNNWSLYFYVLLEILSIVVILGLVNENKSPSYKIAWISIVLVLPVAGHAMYYLWGKRTSTKKIADGILKKIHHGWEYLDDDSELTAVYEEKFPQTARMTRYMSHEKFPLFKNNKVDYFPMGEDAFRSIFRELENAEKFILIHFFIVAEGAIWDRLHEILKRKINTGVEVKFIYDDFGAMLRTETDFKRNLEEEGFEVRVFNPIHKYMDKLYMNYRSHQKILVIDGNVGYTGGFNLADEYANLIDRFGVWKDNGIRLEGDAVWGLTTTFLQMWEACKVEEPFIDYSPYRPTQIFTTSEVYCHVISDGPTNNPENPIECVYRQMIQHARKYVYITTPYLIIEDDMRQALITAVKSGVDVRIITPNIPDKKNVKILTNYNYGTLLKNGVKIYEYTPGFIHAKTIINEVCGIVGTINMDYRSFYLHYENGVWISDKDTMDVIKADLVTTMKESHEYTYEEWKNRPIRWKLAQPVLNLFSTLM